MNERGAMNEPRISYEHFCAVDLRVGVIRQGRRRRAVPGGDPLLDPVFEFKVDLGEKKPRTIFLRLAGSFIPEEMIGEKVAVVANVQRDYGKDFLSQGTLLTAIDSAGRLTVVTLEALTLECILEPGTRIA
jgi:methionyl-tRNA synthetase